MRRLLIGVLQGLAAAAIVGATLFSCAWRLDIPQFWIYAGIIAATTVASVLLVDPSLYAERLRPGGQPLDPRYWLLNVLIAAHWVVAGLNVGRLHWSPPLPPVAWIVGNLVLAGGMALILWAMHVNRFFSSVVRIQTERGHVVVTQGPYAFIRHPGYAAGVVMAVASGFALGSLWSVAVALAALPLLYVRVIHEDRTLHDELPGYADYAKRVRWRIIPGIW